MYTRSLNFGILLEQKCFVSSSTADKHGFKFIYLASAKKQTIELRYTIEVEKKIAAVLCVFNIVVRKKSETKPKKIIVIETKMVNKK